MSLFRQTEPRLLSSLRTSFRWSVALMAMLAACSGSSAQPASANAPKSDAVVLAPGAIPDPYKLSMLIRTTLIALNQANQTGNYSVLRDLGTPQFQAMNSGARLAEIFAGLRKRELDLSPILFFDPKLVREPAKDPSGLVRVTGFIPTSPERVLFDMGFELVRGRWRISAIVVDVQRIPAGPPVQPSENADSKSKPAKPTTSKTPNSAQ